MSQFLLGLIKLQLDRYLVNLHSKLAALVFNRYMRWFSSGRVITVVQ
jgi:hypothetical protein